MPKQLTSNILMVRPAHFGFNPETAKNNAFQVNDTSLSVEAIKNKAIAEFDAFVSKLRAVGVNVIVKQDSTEPVKTDAVFPNNWVSFHEEGYVITYPMYSAVRRLERRDELIEAISEDFQIDYRVLMEAAEEDNVYLEGTGSIVLDRANKIAYACLSVRTNEQLLDDFCKETGFTKVAFDALDRDGTPIYHTNVMMAMGDAFVVICMESILEAQRPSVLDAFETTNKEVIDIGFDQMYGFAGNMLQVSNESGDTFMVMSQQAFESLEAQHIAQIEKYTTILHSDIKTIETYGGGSARCMMAEVFLPKIKQA